ncbi:hypothetical protein COOONC_16464 [Cooperia oncophora]
MSALIAYIMVCNATRNEAAYKTICGSVMEVARFPNPKQRTMSRELTTCKSGLFGLDKKSHRWLQYYRKLRARYATTNIIRISIAPIVFSLVSQRDDISREEDMLWSDMSVSHSSVSPLLRRFFIILNCEEMAITCNAVCEDLSMNESFDFKGETCSKHLHNSTTTWLKGKEIHGPS